MYFFVSQLFFNFHQIDSKNEPIGDSAHARRQKGGVPEAAEIGRTLIPFQNESTEGKLKNKSKTYLQVTAPMRAAKKEGSLRRPKLAIVSHL